MNKMTFKVRAGASSWEFTNRAAAIEKGMVECEASGTDSFTVESNTSCTVLLLFESIASLTAPPTQSEA